MNLFITNKLKRVIKKFQKDHSKRALEDLWDAINQIYKNEVGKSKRNHALTGKHTNGFKDLHLAGDKYILLYRYDTDSHTLVISAKLLNVVEHDALNKSSTYAEPQWIGTTLDELDKLIHSSTSTIQIDDDSFDTSIEDWFYDYYNAKIAKIMPIDDIEIVHIYDFNTVVQLKLKGIQYYEFYSKDSFHQKRDQIIRLCSKDGITCTMSMIEFVDSDEFLILMKLNVPLEIVEE